MMKLSPAVEEFLNERRFGVLATINEDGSPQQTVMWYQLIDGQIMMNTRRGRVKDQNLLRDRRVSFCVEDGQRYVAMRGAVTVDEDPVRGQATIRALATRYDGQEAADRAVESDFRHQHRVTLDMQIAALDVHGFED